MPVNTTHPEYDAYAPTWRRARHVIAGEDAIKAAGETYLPKLGAQNDEEYEGYKMRAHFFNATSRTMEGCLGMIFRRQPVAKLPEGKDTMENYLHDMDLKGSNLSAYTKSVTQEVLAVGRAGTLIEWEDKVEQRAFVVRYCAEDIINWRTARINGRMFITLVVLQETVPANPLDTTQANNPNPRTLGRTRVEAPRKTEAEVYDEFNEGTINQLRVLKLVPTGMDTATVQRLEYQVEIYQEREIKDKKTEYVLTERRTPTRMGKPLPSIPFVFHGPKLSCPNVEKLPLDDLIAVNLDHYRLNADYKHGLHYTGLPTAWVSGFPKETNLRIGSGTAWVTETIGASAGYLEFTGQGLNALVAAQDKDERYMAILGARLLEENKKEAETAEVLQIRQSGEGSVLHNAAAAVGHSMTKVIKWIYWWHSTEPFPESIKDTDCSLNMNTDFIGYKLPADKLLALVRAWQGRAISHHTLLHNFMQGEVLPPGLDIAEELELIEAEPPPMPFPAEPGAKDAGQPPRIKNRVDKPGTGSRDTDH